MKRCPQCNSSFPDTVQFCDLDGVRLVADYSDSNRDLSVPREDRAPQTVASAGVGAGSYQVRDPRAGPLRQNSKILSIAAVAGVAGGVAVGLVLFIVYQRMTHPSEQSPNESSNVSVEQQQIPLLSSRPSPSVSALPSPEPSPSPSAMPSPAGQAEPARVALSSSLVSTGGNEKRGPVTIRLTNGTSIEADEVWETREGIWYRRRGVVTLLERDEVKAIEKPTPAPSAPPTPATSPGATP